MNWKAVWIVGLLVATVCRAAELWPLSPELSPLIPLPLANDEFVSASKPSETQIVLTRRDGSSQELTAMPIQLAAWDPDAAVYVSAGTDGQPGVAGVDDEGNGTVDDRSELGATGSDDPMLTPDRPDYSGAASGKLTSLRLSLGAMRLVTDSQAITGPRQIRIDAYQGQRLVSRIVDLVPGP